jgi:hypothetical protein
MSDSNNEKPKPEMSPEMRREVSRRNFISNEMGKAGVKAIKQLPGFGGLLGLAFRESDAQRDERLVENLWLLLMGRKPEAKESSAGMELVRNAKSPDEKGDALVDILWALCQTKEFDDLKRPNRTLVRGLYRIAMDREPHENEMNAALTVLSQSEENAQRIYEEAQNEGTAEISLEDAGIAARVAALEGLFTGLIRGHESVLRRTGGRR